MRKNELDKEKAPPVIMAIESTPPQPPKKLNPVILLSDLDFRGTN